MNMKCISKLALASIVLIGAAAKAQNFSDNIHQRSEKEVAPVTPVTPAGEEHYYGARGLITLEGPSGMFINPTSGTLPRGRFTLQYCLFFPNVDTDVIGHGWLLGIGITDWLEIGAIASYININAPVESDHFAGGPQVRVRLLRDKAWWPELCVGSYARWGDHALNKVGVYVAASKRFIIDSKGVFRSVAVHAGFRQLWLDSAAPGQDSSVGYIGTELEFPYRIYAVGEVSTRDQQRPHADKTPFAFGLQCRLPAVALSVAGIQAGDQDNLGFWFGIGTSLPF
jgi:hypothetical protein